LGVYENNSIFAPMKILTRIISIATVLMLMAAATGCSERQEHLDALNRAISLMDDHPDSALSVLDSLGKHQADFGHHFNMQYRLHRLNAYNKLDTVFRTTDEASQLVTYFDDHGTSNEQMLAYYLLGRAFFDLHEAPQALHYFQIASERADTTAADCNYKQLCRVYGQMSDIFYQQNLMNESLDNENKSIEYAWLGKDTLSVIRANINKVSIYFELSQVDLAIKLCEKTSFMAQEFGYPQIASSTLGLLIRYMIEKGELEKAKLVLARDWAWPSLTQSMMTVLSWVPSPWSTSITSTIPVWLSVPRSPILNGIAKFW